jgi:hypothetical protein
LDSPETSTGEDGCLALARGKSAGRYGRVKEWGRDRLFQRACHGDDVSEVIAAKTASVIIDRFRILVIANSWMVQQNQFTSLDATQGRTTLNAGMRSVNHPG